MVHQKSYAGLPAVRYYCPKTKLPGGNVFRRVCLSTVGRGLDVTIILDALALTKPGDSSSGPPPNTRIPQAHPCTGIPQPHPCTWTPLGMAQDHLVWHLVVKTRDMFKLVQPFHLILTSGGYDNMYCRRYNILLLLLWFCGNWEFQRTEHYIHQWGFKPWSHTFRTSITLPDHQSNCPQVQKKRNQLKLLVSLLINHIC